MSKHVKLSADTATKLNKMKALILQQNASEIKSLTDDQTIFEALDYYLKNEKRSQRNNT